MELFSIGDEPEAEDCAKLKTEKRSLHPAFLVATLPIAHVPKGQKMRSLPQPLFYSLQVKGKTALEGLVSPEKQRTNPRVLQVQDEYIYAYDRQREFWVVAGVWALRRLLLVELSEKSPSEITLVFPNKSLDPADPLVRKTFDVPDLPGFLSALRTGLKSCDIDLELDGVRGLWKT